jgi:hypothetical protein
VVSEDPGQKILRLLHQEQSTEQKYVIERRYAHHKAEQSFIDGQSPSLQNGLGWVYKVSLGPLPLRCDFSSCVFLYLLFQDVDVDTS